MVAAMPMDFMGAAAEDITDSDTVGGGASGGPERFLLLPFFTRARSGLAGGAGEAFRQASSVSSPDMRSACGVSILESCFIWRVRVPRDASLV